MAALRLLALLALTLVWGISAGHAAVQYACEIDTTLGQPAIKREDGRRLFGKASWTRTAISAATRRIKKKLKSTRKPLTERARAKLIAKRKNLTRLMKRVRQCPTPPARVVFADIAPILQARCMSCHVTQGTWQNSESWYLSTARVVAGNLAASTLYTYLSGNFENYAPAYMPRGLEPLPHEQLALIRQWIVDLDPNVSPPPSDFEFSCNADRPAPIAPLKRLSRLQIRNTFLDLLLPFNDSDRALIYQRISAPLETFPADAAQQNFLEERAFSGTDLTVSPQHINALYDAAVAFADEVTLHSARRFTFSHGDCNFGTNTAGRNCVRNFIARFGRRTHRRPLSSIEASEYETFYFSRPTGSAFKELIVTMLMSPDFFYVKEVEGALSASKPDTLDLSAFELASRLSFLLWQSMPDEELFDAGADGSLLTPAGFQTQLNRLYDNARTRETIDLFFEELLGAETLPALNGTNSPAFAAFAAGLSIPPGDTELPHQMRRELDDLVEHYVWETEANFDALFTSRHSFARESELSALYGVAPWDGSHTNLVPFPSDAEARGLIGRALFQISGSHLKETARLGARILREWNCTQLADPPPDLMNQIRPPAYDPTKSTRQRYTDLTAPIACAGCHAQINPLGFAMERLDALGRYRMIERVYAPNGTLAAEIPIDSTVNFSPIPGVSRQVSTPIEVFRAMTESGRVQACFSQQYFRFAHRRHEDTTADGCALQELHEELTSDQGSMKRMFKKIAESAEFRQRRVVD